MKLNLILFSLLIIFALVKINAHHLYRVNHHALEIEKQKTIELKDGTLPDNRRAMRSLAKDQKFETIIRSQYDK